MQEIQMKPRGPGRRKLAHRYVAAIAVSGVVAAGGVVGSTMAAHAATGPTVSAWVTTPDRAQLLSQVGAQTFSTDGSQPGQMITIDPTQTMQTMDGFGASLTDASASLLYGLPQSQRDSVMKSIFDPSAGIGMSLLRQPIGASDFVNGPHYTYDDMPSGQTDLNMDHFSIAHDDAQILPLLRQALTLNPKLKVMGSPWSPPAWMKTNGSLVGGQLKNDAATQHAYALYLLKFVQAYQAAGVPIYALTVQNEPQNRSPDAYPGTDMPVAHEAAVINQLGPLLRDNGFGSVKILGYDHNWAEHPDDITDAGTLGVPPEPNYPYDLLNTTAAQWIAGTAYHCYAGDVSAQTAMHNAHPDKDIYFTECSGWHGVNDSPSTVFNDTLKWHAKNLTIGVTKNWSKTLIDWNLALNSQGGPVNGGCGNNTAGVCTGALQIDGTTVVNNAEYYTLGHLSKFVQPGAVHIGSTDAGDMQSVAFQNPDGSIAAVIDNTGGGSQTFGISYNGMFVSYTVPSGALMTATWPGTSTPTPTPTPSPTTTVTPTPTPSPTTTPVGSINSASWYQVINSNSNKCLDDADFGTGNGAHLQQWDCGNPAQNNQEWQFRPTSGGYYQVVSRQANIVWDVDGGASATGNGSSVHLWSYVSGTNQQWKPTALSNGNYSFTARNSGKCLDVRDVSTSNGAGLQQWDCHGGPAQSFKLVQK